MIVRLELSMEEFHSIVTNKWDQFDIPDDYKIKFIPDDEPFDGHSKGINVDRVLLTWDSDLELATVEGEAEEETDETEY